MLKDPLMIIPGLKYQIHFKAPLSPFKIPFALKWNAEFESNSGVTVQLHDSGKNSLGYITGSLWGLGFCA